MSDFELTEATTVFELTDDDDPLFVLEAEVTVFELVEVGTPGPAGTPATYSNATPQPLGVPSAGSAASASRADHVHEMPDAADVGADPAGSAATVGAALTAHLSDTSDAHDGSAISLTTGTFDGNLDGTVTDVQALAEAVDELVTGSPLSDDDPEPAGVADPGVSTEVSRSDHVHPLPPISTYVYNSSGAQGGNRYNDWADLMAEIGSGSDGPKVIQFEQSETLPAGAYDLTNVTLVGNGFGVLTGANLTLTVPTGVTFTNPIVALDLGLLLLWTGTSVPLMSSAAAFRAFRLGRAAAVLNSGSEPIATVSAGTFVLEGLGDSIIFGGSDFGGNPLLEHSGGAIAYTQQSPGGYWNNNIVTTSVGITITVFYYDPGPLQAPSDGAIGGSGGTYTINRTHKAQFIAYDAADVAGDWSGVAPSSLADALDRIAADAGPIA